MITLDPLTRDRKFVRLLRTALMRLEQAYQNPVDIEFTVEIRPDYPQPDYRLCILQCRPLSQREDARPVTIPEEVPEEDLLFHTFGLIPHGTIEGIRYIIYVDPRRFRTIESYTERFELGRAIGRLNKALEGDLCPDGAGSLGHRQSRPGRPCGYADIYNTKALIEVAVADGDDVPELSYGTHFFQDLVEDGIYALPVHLDNPQSYLNWEFFANAPNALERLSPADAALQPYLKVIDLAAIEPGRRLTILMDGAKDEAVAILEPGDRNPDELKSNDVLY